VKIFWTKLWWGWYVGTPGGTPGSLELARTYLRVDHDDDDDDDRDDDD